MQFFYFYTFINGLCNTVKEKFKKVSIFCGRIYCEECGCAYGSKIWHSNDKYRKVIWQENHKFKNKEHFCTTPHVDDKRLKEMFLEVVATIFNRKNAIIKDFELINDILFKPTNENEITELQSEMNVVANMIKAHERKLC